MKIRFVSLLKTFLIIAVVSFTSKVSAEYYLVYSASSDGCSSCVEKRVTYKYKYKYKCHPRKVTHHVRHHYPRYSYHPRSHYNISVYYPNYEAPCCMSCGCVSRCGCQRTQPVNNFVTFSGQPARYDSYFNGTDSNYYQDRRTADDIYSDMNIDN